MPKRVDDGTNVPNQIVNRILAKVRGKLENKKCFDCPEKNPQWASVTFGVLLCTNCSGRHRRLGTHISFVRSTTMDGWSVAQLKRMFVGGNLHATEHFSKHGIQLNAIQSRTKSIENKYCCKPARLYVTTLDQKIKKYQLDDDTQQQIEKYVAEKRRAHKKKHHHHRHGHHHDTDSGTSSSEDDDDTLDSTTQKGSSMISSAKKEEIHQLHEKAANEDLIYESHVIAKHTHHHHHPHSHSLDKNKKKKKKNPFLDDDDLDDLEDFDEDKNNASSTNKKGAASVSKTVSADIDDFDFDDLEEQIEKDKKQRVQLKAKQEEERRQREELQLQKDRDRELKRKEKEKRRAEKYKDGGKEKVSSSSSSKYGGKKKNDDKVYSMKKIADLNEVKKTQAMSNNDPFGSLDDLANAIKKEQSDKHKFLYTSNRSGF